VTVRMIDDASERDEPRPGAHPEKLPTLSVVIACLNAATTLGAQLRALAGQPCPVPWELLVCDNGSTDSTVAVALGFADRLPGMRIVDASAVRGAGAARNRGVEEARGEWIALCDADDVVAYDWLARMCEALAEHRFVAGRFEWRRLNGGRVLRSRPMEQQRALQSSDVGARLPHAGAGNLGIHRKDFVSLGGFDPTMPWLEDTDFSWRAQLTGVPLVFRPEVVVHVRLRQTFRSMFVQGRQYGAAHAILEERYGRPAQSPPSSGVRGARRPGRRPSVPSPRRAVTWFVDHFVGGRIAWRIGWVVGHRSHRTGQGSTARPNAVPPGREPARTP
jgi:glycosyltransferase involved in cell wall biosynthesis